MYFSTAVIERVDVLRQPLGVGVRRAGRSLFSAHERVAERDTSSRNFQVVSMCSSGNGSGAGWNAFMRQAHQHGRVLADRVEHHRVLELGRDLADDVDALGFELP